MSVTIKDVARRANVSVATVSRALNGRDHVGEAVRKRVREAADALDYSPHHAARSLSSRRTRTIGVVLPDLPCEVFAQLMCGIDQAARERGMQLLVSGHHASAESQGEALRSMRGRVDGLIALSPYSGLDLEAARIPGKLPVLLLDSEPGVPGASTLGSDHHAGAMAVVRHLVENGYREIAFVGGRQPYHNARERERGYLQAMAELLPAVRPRVLQGDSDAASGARAGQMLAAADGRPDAVFAANDMMALGCLFAFQRAGLRVPGDVAVAGFNDIPLARHASPPLTSVRIDIPALGAEALVMLLDGIASGGAPRHRRIAPRLVVRASTAQRAQ